MEEAIEEYDEAEDADSESSDDEWDIIHSNHLLVQLMSYLVISNYLL